MIGITVAVDATMEISMKDMQTEPGTEQDTTIPVAETTTTEKNMSSKTKSAKVTKKVKPAKEPRAAKVKATKEPKAKKERVAKEDNPNRTFAIRISDDELAAIHKTAGPRNATRFVRAVAAAFATEDDAAFKAVVKEAREARA